MAKVLIIDDEFGIVELLEAVLSDEGHEVSTACNGKQGLQVLEALTPDVIFLDFMMPVMDGPTVLHHLSTSRTLGAIPVIMMSSIPEATVAEQCKGYARFLRKPFSIFDVVAIVAQSMPAQFAQN